VSTFDCQHCCVSSTGCTASQTRSCTTSDNCAGTQTCTNGNWGTCVDIPNDNCPSIPGSKVDISGPATTCNVNIPYVGNEGRYAVWNGQCNAARQADNSNGVGQGCCELACDAAPECDEQYAGQGNCDSNCMYLPNCPNPINSNYGNRICKSNTDISNCNWPSGTESVSKNQISNGLWEITFTSTSAKNVNVFVTYGRIISITQPNWNPAGYAKPGICPQDSSEDTCNPQILGTRNYCNFRLPSSQLMADLSTPSIITESNPARALMPLPLSSSNSAKITVRVTDEAVRRGIQAVVYYQFNKDLTGSNYDSSCLPGVGCSVNDCGGMYTGCSSDKTSMNAVLCVKTQSSNVQVIPACWHYPWESMLWDTMNLTSVSTVPLDCTTCNAGSKCSCTVNGCSAGTWTITNMTYPPATETKISNIPPVTIEFTPTNAGSLNVTASCSNPQQINKTTVYVGGNLIACPSTCYTGEECECQISGCSNGNFVVMNGSATIKMFTFPPMTSSIKFVHNSIGTLSVTGSCNIPVKTMTVSVTMSQKSAPTTTTTTILLQDCSSECCKGQSGYKDKDCMSGYVCKNNKCEVELQDCLKDCCVGETGYEEKPCADTTQKCVNNKCQGATGGSDMLTLAIIIIVVLVAAYFLYFFVLKKKTKVTFDSLYQKWPTKPRNY